MLYECHGHIMLDGASFKNAVSRHKEHVSEHSIRINLQACAESGIVFYRDGGDKYAVSSSAGKLAADYGIDYRTPGFMIHKKGFYGGLFGHSFSNMDEYRALVAKADNDGADFIKIAVSGMLDFSGTGGVTDGTLSPDELYSMVTIAQSEGFAVMAHVNGAENVKNALLAGVNSIEHGFYTDEYAFPLFTASGAVWVPTCTAVENLIGSGRFDDALLKKIMSEHKRSIKKASEYGVAIACGSDAGAGCVTQGGGAITELGILQSIGINADRGNEKICTVFKRF